MLYEASNMSKEENRAEEHNWQWKATGQDSVAGKVSGEAEQFCLQVTTRILKSLWRLFQSGEL